MVRSTTKSKKNDSRSKPNSSIYRTRSTRKSSSSSSNRSKTSIKKSSRSTNRRSKHESNNSLAKKTTRLTLKKQNEKTKLNENKREILHRLAKTNGERQRIQCQPHRLPTFLEHLASISNQFNEEFSH